MLNEAKIFKVLKVIGLVRYFPAKIKKSVKNSKNDAKMLIFWQFFEVFSGLGEKYCIKLKYLTLLEFFASFDTHNTYVALLIVDILCFNHLFSKF